MPRSLQFVTIAATALLVSGCLREETTHTLYIAPDRTVEWLADEADVHSDEKGAAERHAEEREYIAAAAAGMSPVARALASLGPEEPVTTSVVRDASPFRVLTKGRFDSLERILGRLFVDSGIGASIRLTEEDGLHALAIALDFATVGTEDEGPSAILLGDAGRLRFVLHTGRFVRSDGFVLRGERVAVVSKDWIRAAGIEHARGGTMQLSLRWRDR
jgi:hypothetical protein